jgi:hypothetical protein
LTSDCKILDASLTPVRNGARRRLRYSASRLAKVIALLLFTLAFGESFVRVLCPQAVMPRYVTGTPWGVRGNIPGARYWHYTPEVAVQYRINSQGLRADHDFALTKTPGTCRIAAFGDSLLMGYEVDLRDSFSTQLEEQLRALGISAEVLNFAVSGFGTAEMLRTYESFARRFHPDLVIFSWHMTDLEDNVRSQLFRLDNGALEPANETYLPGVKTQDFLMRIALYRFISDHSQLYALLRERLGQFAKRLGFQLHQQRVAAKVRQGEDEDDAMHAAHVKANDDLSSAIVEHASGIVAKDGREFYLLEIPIRESRIKFHSSVDVLSESVRSRLNIISPLTSFRQVARPELKLYYERGEGHLTPLGVQLLAAETARTLARSTLDSFCRAPQSQAASPGPRSSAFTQQGSNQ